MAWLPPVGFESPDLGVLADGRVIGPSSSRHYRETYYDTEDLDLLRFGATLFRVAESGRYRWTIQLYQQYNGDFVAQLESPLVREGAVLPDEFLGLLFGFHRGHPLLPVAEIAITEISVEFFDTSGEPLGTYADRLAKGDGRHFVQADSRTVEFSVASCDKGALRLEKEMKDLLTVAGCEISTQTPEIFQMLDGIGLALYAGSPSKLLPSPSAYQVFQWAITKSLLRLFIFDLKVRVDPDVDMVHEIRVAIRRLRSDLRSFAIVLDANSEHTIRDDLAWIGDEVGKARDNDVLFLRVRALTERCGEADRDAAENVLGLIEAERSTYRRSMMLALNSNRYCEAVKRLTDIATGAVNVEKKQETPVEPNLEVVRNIVRRRWKKFSNAAKKIDKSSSDYELHRVRILAKRCRYAAEAAAPIIGKRARELGAMMTKVQDLLGEYHDCVIHESWLRETATLLPESRIAIGEMIFMIEQERDRLRGKWSGLWAKVSTKKRVQWLLASPTKN